MSATVYKGRTITIEHETKIRSTDQNGVPAEKQEFLRAVVNGTPQFSYSIQPPYHVQHPRPWEPTADDYRFALAETQRYIDAADTHLNRDWQTFEAGGHVPVTDNYADTFLFAHSRTANAA